MIYTLLLNGAVRRNADGAIIPTDPANTDYGAFLAWQAAGGVPAVELPPPPSRVISGAAFLGLFTTAERAAMLTADPRILDGAFKVAAQGSCNLDSPDCAALLDLAISKGALAAERKAAILAGEPPA